MSEKDRLVDDLSSLFLPDLNQNNDNFKRDSDINVFDNVPQESYNNFNNFLSNNQFISYKTDPKNQPQNLNQIQNQGQNQNQNNEQDQNQNQNQHHFSASYVSSDSNNPNNFGMNTYNQVQQNLLSQPINPSHPHGQILDNYYPSHNHYSNFVPVEATRQLTYNNHIYPPRNDWLSDQLLNHGIFHDHLLSKTPTPGLSEKSTTNRPPKKKAKPRKKDLKTMDFVINYQTKQLKRLLDLKKVSQNNNFTIVDKSNNPVTIGFNGFLNGKFLTNDHENCNYILTKNGGTLDQSQIDAIPKNQNPQVISCYRRNYIQISLDMNISGLHKTNSKILRLQTSEYGYTITRVIKYFKLEIMAKTRSNKTNVPILIKSSNSKKDSINNINNSKDKKLSPVEDNIIFNQIVKPEHIFLLDENIDQGSISKYFVIKKLQFKKATPNNGSLTFQNYYHLIVKLSAAVADLYYDDYVDDEFNNGLNGTNSDNNEVTLAELISEPIIVRGRNPHFYAERKDILIKGRTNTLKKSFELASRDYLDETGDDYMEADDDIDDDENEEGETEDQRGFNEGNIELDDGYDGDEGNEDEGDEEPVPYDENDEDEEQSISQVDYIDNSDNSNNNKTNNQVSPLAYNTINQQIDLNGVVKYKYFPISKVYYLPPINVVYFPHGAHHNLTKEPNNAQDELQEQETKKRRTSSNVYFK